MIAWSYSSWAMFEECPRRFKAIVLDKEFERGSSPALVRGDEIHRVIADYLREPSGDPPKYLPPRARRMIAQLIARAGKPKVELKLAVNEKMEPVPYFDPSVVLRGNVDAVWIDQTTKDAYVFDWKTGKSEANPLQLDLMCVLVSAHVVNDIERFHAMFYYLENERNNYALPERSADELRRIFTRFYTEATELYRTSTFEPTPGPHCRWCPVTTCPHNPNTVPTL